MADSEDYIGGGEPNAHATSHELGGSDVLDLTGLTPADHASRHQNGGADEIDASGLTGVGHQLVDRGDPSGVDFNETVLTLDSAWYDLDCSAIVPAGAIAIEFLIRQLCTTVGKTSMFRLKGNTNTYNVLDHKCIVANVNEFWGGFSFCNSGRVVEYFFTGTAGVWTSIDIIIRAWRI